MVGRRVWREEKDEESDVVIFISKTHFVPFKIIIC